MDDRRLDDAILQLEEGKYPFEENKGEILIWFKALREARQREVAESRARVMESLTKFWHLTQDEAERVYTAMLNGDVLRFEKGQCRACKGKGRVERFIRSTCFGQETLNESCIRCAGSGTDEKRIRVPASTASQVA